MTDFQSRAGEQGRAFEETVGVLLQIEGWTIKERHWRHPVLDVEIDVVADDPDGREWWIECKGSWEGTRPGLARTDTLKKALGSAALLDLADEARPYMIVASHPPKDGSAGDIWLHRAVGRFVDQVRYVGFTEIRTGAT